MDFFFYLKYIFTFILTTSILTSKVQSFSSYTVIPSLGRLHTFGTIYNSHSHNFIEGRSVFKSPIDTKVLHSSKYITYPKPVPLTSVNFIYSIQDKFKLASISPTLSLAILSELIPPTQITGSEHFLLNQLRTKPGLKSEIENEDPSTEVTKITGAQVTESQLTQELLDIFNPKIIPLFSIGSCNCNESEIGIGTHFVAGIIRGNRSISTWSAYEPISIIDAETAKKEKEEIEAYIKETLRNPWKKNDLETSVDTSDFSVPVSYILLPIPLIKSFLRLTKDSEVDFSHSSLVQMLPPLPPKVSNAPFSFINEQLALQFSEVFDDAYKMQQGLNDAITYVKTTVQNKTLFPHGLHPNEFLNGLKHLQSNFDNGFALFKEELQKGLRIAAKLSENCEEGLGVEVVLKILLKYKDHAYSPCKVKGVMYSILFKFRKIVRCPPYPCDPKPPHPGGEVPNVNITVITKWKADSECEEVLECVKSGSGNYKLSENVSDTLHVAVNPGLASNIPAENIQEIEHLVCIHNIAITKRITKLTTVEVRAQIVKHVVETLAHCTAYPRATMHNQQYFKGDDEIYDYKENCDSRNFRCMDLKEVGGNVNSLDTRESCVRLYAKEGCKGESRLFAGNKASWPRNTFVQAKSIASCYYEYQVKYDKKRM